MTWKRNKHTHTRPAWYQSLDGAYMIQSGSEFTCYFDDAHLGDMPTLGAAKHMCEMHSLNSKPRKPFVNSEDKAAHAVFKRLERWCAETSNHVIGYTGLCRPETVTEYPTKMWECNLEDGLLESDGMADTLAGAIEQALDRIGAKA